MARINVKEDRHDSDLSPIARIIVNSLLLLLSIIAVNLTWYLDIYHNHEAGATIIHKEAHFLLGITTCIFLNSIAFLKDNRVAAINIKTFTVISLLLFFTAIPVYIEQSFFPPSFFCGILYFVIGIIFYILFCKFLEIIDSFILQEDEQKSGENNEI